VTSPRVFEAIRLARCSRAGGLIAVLACYLDDSDAVTSKALTIAGYVAHEEGWLRFEQVAEALCDEYGVGLIRGRQIDGRKDCFKGWSLPKCERFLDQLGTALVGNVLFGIGRSIGKDNYKLRRRQLMTLDNVHRRTFSSMSAFGFCFASLLLDLRENGAHGVSDEVKQDGIAFMLESGSANNPDIFRYLDAERRNGNINVNVTATEVDKRSCRAIQMADLYAFYSRRRANQFARFKGKLEFVTDIHKLHIGRKVHHDTGFIEEPFIKGTNQRTGETFSFTGLLSRMEQ
jgi:hypothetical protein